MEHGWSLYFLSIVDNGRGVAVFVLCACAAAAFVALMVSSANFERAANETGRRIVKPFIKPVAVICGVALLVLVLLPTRRDVIESYLMLEGQEIVNTKTAEKVGDRVDKLLDSMEKKWLLPEPKDK